MPIVDSTHKMIFQDPKPDRVCQYSGCPNGRGKYKGMKMKACARCNWIRYCVSFTFIQTYDVGDLPVI